MSSAINLEKDSLVTYMVGGLFSADPGWRHNRRFHKGDYELMICVKGPIYLKVANQHIVLNPNELLIIPPYTTMQGTHSSNNSVEFYWLHFFLPKNSEDLARDSTDIITINSFYHIDNIEPLIVTVNQLLSTNSSNQYRQTQENLTMTLLLVQLAEHSSSPTDNQNILINRLKEWIRVNIYQQPSLTDLAEEAGLNPQYLSRLFKRQTGMSPKQYMMSLKIQTAQALLVSTNLSVKEVSNYSYFTDEKLFLKQFKANTGVTPKNYRKNYSSIYHNNEKIDPVLPIPKEITGSVDEINNTTDKL